MILFEPVVKGEGGRLQAPPPKRNFKNTNFRLGDVGMVFITILAAGAIVLTVFAIREMRLRRIYSY